MVLSSVHARLSFRFLSLFFFTDTATTAIYTLSLHDALPICHSPDPAGRENARRRREGHSRRGLLLDAADVRGRIHDRSEEHTSELQSLTNLVCRLLLEKKKTQH